MNIQLVIFPVSAEKLCWKNVLGLFCTVLSFLVFICRKYLFCIKTISKSPCYFVIGKYFPEKARLQNLWMAEVSYVV